jgi:tetratricopeptide (TPR) repeat protein
MWAWLFFLTAGVGVWAAYDQVAALETLALLTAGLVALYVIDRLGRMDAERTLVWGGVGCAAWAALLGTLVLLPGRNVYTIREDAIAAALIILIPLGGGSLLWLWPRGDWFVAGVVAWALAWALAMLFLTGERSAWFALAVALLSTGTIWLRFVWARRGWRVWPLDVVGVGAALAALALYTLMLTAPDFHSQLPLGDRWTVVDHLEVWRDGLVLIQDYPFTGSGLSATGMVYSTYVLLFHVVHLDHLHNLYLQLAIEQGLPGLLTFVGMVASALYALLSSWHKGDRAEDGLRSAAFLALAAMLLHGLLDSELYASWLLPLLFLPIGFAWVAARLDQYVIDDRRFGRPKCPSKKRMVMGRIAGGVILIAALLLARLPTVQAAFQANLGAIVQTQNELSAYTSQQWALQDAVRRSPALSLEPAIVRYEAALQLDPKNVTALRRLGQIALSRGDYETAQRYLERAYSHAPQQRIIHLLLGEMLAVSGHVEQGAALWSSAAIEPSWLSYRRWWYMHIGATQQAAWISDAITLIGHHN